MCSVLSVVCVCLSVRACGFNSVRHQTIHKSLELHRYRGCGARGMAEACWSAHTASHSLSRSLSLLLSFSLSFSLYQIFISSSLLNISLALSVAIALSHTHARAFSGKRANESLSFSSSLSHTHKHTRPTLRSHI